MLLRARPDPALAARVRSRKALVYDEGADPAVDRPAHVRAGSALALVDGPRLVVVQDDAAFLALVDPASGRATSVMLPAGPGGARQFDDGRGNKADKLDLESAVAVGAVIYAFGSGSTDRRRRVVIVDTSTGALRVVDAGPLYEMLGVALPGVELNVEGAVIFDDVLRLAHRGNGRGDGNTDALVHVPWAPLRAFLDGAGPCPTPTNVVRVDLGAIGGVRLTWTDLAVLPRAGGDALVFLAAAEASPDAYRDGPVAGCAIGVLEDVGGRDVVRVGALLGEDGAPLPAKPEGVCVDPRDPSTLWIVVDPDDPARPTELLTATLD